jgi:hypothetical protein
MGDWSSKYRGTVEVSSSRDEFPAKEFFITHTPSPKLLARNVTKGDAISQKSGYLYVKGNPPDKVKDMLFHLFSPLTN